LSDHKLLVEKAAVVYVLLSPLVLALSFTESQNSVGDGACHFEEMISLLVAEKKGWRSWLEEYGDERRKVYECNRVCRTGGGEENRTWRLFFLEENENVRVLSFEFFFLLFLKHGHREKDSRFENTAQ